MSRKSLLLSSFLLVWPLWIVSDEVCAEDKQKIAVVSMQLALNEVDEGKRAKEKIQEELNAKKKQLESMRVSIQQMKDDFDKKRVVLSKEAQETQAKDLQTKFAEFQQKVVEFDRELSTKESESVQKILVALKKLVIEMAEAKGLDIVYENSAETVLYSKNALDLTQELITTYNKKSK